MLFIFLFQPWYQQKNGKTRELRKSKALYSSFLFIFWGGGAVLLHFKRFWLFILSLTLINFENPVYFKQHLWGSLSMIPFSLKKWGLFGRFVKGRYIENRHCRCNAHSTTVKVSPFLHGIVSILELSFLYFLLGAFWSDSHLRTFIDCLKYLSRPVIVIIIALRI